jgi:hypothetical protein
MDEIELLQSLGHETPPPDVATKRAARAALLAHVSATQNRRRWLPGRSMRLGRPRLLIAVATFAIIVVLASGLLPTGLRPDVAAAAALNRAADIAALQAEGPNDGYRHTKAEGAWLNGVGGSPERPNGVWTLVPVSREIWIKPDGSGRLIESRSEPIWFGPADQAAWVAEGSPDFHIQPHSDTTFGPTNSGVDPSTSPTAAPQEWPGSLYYEDVDALPTDTGTLRRLIDDRAAANGGPTDYERFTIVGDLLRETVAAPKVRAALFRVAAGLNGVELIGPVTDRAGRTGTAVSMTNAQSSRGLERRTLIFDPETSALLAEEEVLLNKVDWLDAEPPIVIGYNTYLVSDIVPALP